MGEVFAKTPIGCQLECVQPGPESFMYTRNVAPPRAMPDRDPCNKQEDAKKPQPSANHVIKRAQHVSASAFAACVNIMQHLARTWPTTRLCNSRPVLHAENIWPRLQTEATQPSFRPPRSNIANGDLRADPFITTYSTQFDAPFDYMKKIRSPMRNPDLAHAQELHPLYLSSFNRVTECALQLGGSGLTHTLMRTWVALIVQSARQQDLSLAHAEMCLSVSTLHAAHPGRGVCATCSPQLTPARMICRKRLMKMIASIGERLAAKLANANDNAFKMRRLFKMYDVEATGTIHLDDLRMMMETFGIQLDDDSLLALYHVYDKECTGYLKYDELMKVCLWPVRVCDAPSQHPGNAVPAALS
jgi:hypothetical protein